MPKKGGLGQALWPDSGRHLAARFRPPFGGRNPAANNNSLHWPESGPKTAAGIRPPNRCHVRSHFGLISGGGGGAIAAQFLRPMGAALRTHAGRLSVTFATETGE